MHTPTQAHTHAHATQLKVSLWMKTKRKTNQLHRWNMLFWPTIKFSWDVEAPSPWRETMWNLPIQHQIKGQLYRESSLGGSFLPSALLVARETLIARSKVTRIVMRWLRQTNWKTDNLNNSCHPGGASPATFKGRSWTKPLYRVVHLVA